MTDVEHEDELDCNYGLGFCSHPQIREMGLCTTECSEYFNVVEEQEKGTKP